MRKLHWFRCARTQPASVKETRPASAVFDLSGGAAWRRLASVTSGDRCHRRDSGRRVSGRQPHNGRFLAGGFAPGSERDFAVDRVLDADCGCGGGSVRPRDSDFVASNTHAEFIQCSPPHNSGDYRCRRGHPPGPRISFHRSPPVWTPRDHHSALSAAAGHLTRSRYRRFQSAGVRRNHSMS